MEDWNRIMWEAEIAEIPPENGRVTRRHTGRSRLLIDGEVVIGWVSDSDPRWRAAKELEAAFLASEASIRAVQSDSYRHRIGSLVDSLREVGRSRS